MNAFEKIVGYEKEKKELQRICDMAKDPGKYARAGARVPRGVLLHGEPGVGKTLMATALAKESGRKTFVLRRAGDFSVFMENLGKTFSEAKISAPSVVILDDMDKYAEKDAGEFGRDRAEYVAVQSELDSLEGADVLVIATAGDVRAFPESLMRAGRFDIVMRIRAPRTEEGREIIANYLKGKKVAPDVDAEGLSWILQGRSAAVLEGVLNRAALTAGYAGKDEIEMSDLVEACMHVVYDSKPYDDEKDDFSDSREGLELVALHEAGHAVVAEILTPGDIKFVSLRKAYGSRGMQVSRRNPDNRDFASTDMRIALAGRAATELGYGIPDTGAGRDVMEATEAAMKRVASDCAYGLRYFREDEDMDICDAQDDMIAERVRSELEAAYSDDLDLLRLHWSAVEALAKRLLEKDVVMAGEIREICEF